MKNFALIGVAGFVAPRHLDAILKTNNQLVAAIDKSDSVGVLDRYFPQTHFFTEFERFDRHVEKLKRSTADKKIDYISICSPNYLHDSHIRFALRADAHAICEKPLVLNPWNLDALEELQNEYPKKINTILQLRLHPEVEKLKISLAEKPSNKIFDIDLTYITARGNWYFHSWKSDPEKSGGIISNIGIHFFDLLIYLFGEVQKNEVHLLNEKKAAGFLVLKNANVRWFLSLDQNDLPQSIKSKGVTTYRNLTFDGNQFDLSNQFEDLHYKSYRNILENKGFGTRDSRSGIELSYLIRQSPITQKILESHPFISKAKKDMIYDQRNIFST